MNLRERLDARLGPDVAVLCDAIDALRLRADERDKQIARLQEQVTRLQQATRGIEPDLRG